MAGEASSSEDDEEEEESSSAEEEGKPRPLGLRLQLLLAVLLLTISLVLGIVFKEQLAEAGEALLGVVARLGWLAVLILFLVTAVSCVLMLPSFPLLLASSAEFTRLFGLFWGVTASLTASFGGLWLGSILAFQLGRSVWKDEAERARKDLGSGELFRVLGRMVEEQGVYVVFLARMTPVLNVELFNYACSLTQISLGGYSLGCIGSLVPMSFWAVTTAQATQAAQGKHRHALAGYAVLAFNGLLLLVVTVLLFLSFRRFQEKERLREAQEAKEAAGLPLVA